jgi:predicted DNA binding CopG/RHH family protein
MVRPTIKQQQMLAQKSRKTKSETPTDTSESSTELPTNATETSQKRDKQVTVKFSDQDMERLKLAASKARRPVANLIYSLTMEYVESSMEN